jgi:hypothetical protein
MIDELWVVVDQLKVLGWKEVRPWHEFFATFKPIELNQDYITQRLTTNLLQYRSNYIVIAAVILLVKIIFSPILLFSLLLCAALWYYAFVVHNRPIQLGNFAVDGTMKITACGVISFILLVITGSLESIVWGLFVVLVIVFLHALFRPRSISSRANYVYEDIKVSWFGSDVSSKKSDEISADVPSSQDPENPSYNSTEENGTFLGTDNAAVRKRGAGNISGSQKTYMTPVSSSKYD